MSYFRRNPIFKLLLVILLTSGGVLLWQAWDRSEADAALQAEIERIDALDPGWTFDEILAARTPLADDRNGAFCVRDIAAEIPADWPIWNHVRRSRRFDPFFFDDAKEIPDLVLAVYEKLDLLNFDPREPFNDCACELLRLEMERVEPLLAEAARLEEFEEGRQDLWWPVAWTTAPVPHLEKARRVEDLLRYNAVARSLRGDAEGAAQTALRCAHLARCFGDRDLIITQRVRLAIMSSSIDLVNHGLKSGQAEAATLRRLQELYAREEGDCNDAIVQAARLERALIHRMFQGLESGAISMDDLGPIAWKPKNMWEKFSAHKYVMMLRREHLAALRELTNEIESWKQPWSAIGASGPGMRICCQLQEPWHKNFLGNVEESKFGDTYRQASLRCVVAALACERFRLDRGHWPARLAELVPQYLVEVPRDPYRDAPLNLARIKEGIVIYSVSCDGADNGGFIDPNGFVQPGSDLGFTLVDAAARKPKGRIPR